MSYKKELDVIIGKIDNKFYIIKSGRISNVNEVGARILDLCNGKNTLDDIADKLSKFFNADKQQVRNDVNEYIQKLIELNLVVDK